jgi:hypothetical protein
MDVRAIMLLWYFISSLCGIQITRPQHLLLPKEYNEYMAMNVEAQSGRSEGKFARFYKNFNKISATVFATAGIVTGQEALFLPAAFDVAQIYGVNRFQEWRKKNKTSKGLGKLALSH